MSDIPSWRIVGDWFDNCSCAVACPCTFAQAPDNGFCESVLFWHVREGHYGDVNLDNLSFVRVGRWEGDLWARQATGVAGLYIDDHADNRQMEALPAIIGGRAGGFPGWVNECFAGGRQSRGIERAKISYEIATDLGALGRRDHRQGQGLGEGDQRPDQPARQISAAGQRPRQRDRPGAAACDLGQVDDPLGRRAWLQVRLRAQFGQAYPVRLGGPLIRPAYSLAIAYPVDRLKTGPAR